MGLYFTGSERIQRGRGIGGILRIASKLFAPLASFTKKALSSKVGEKVVKAVKKQAIDSSINIAKDLAAGKNVKESLKGEFENVKQNSKRKALEMGSDYLESQLKSHSGNKKNKKNIKNIKNIKKYKNNSFKRKDILS
jgi:LPS O-antigen subunit length determinant protein (WzzB/FepE family)